MMEHEEEPGSASQNQNLHDFQNYLVSFKNGEIGGGDEDLPTMDVDSRDVTDLYSDSTNHLQDPGDAEVSGQFSSGFYSEQDEAEVDSEMNSGKDEVVDIDLESVQAQMTHYESQLGQSLPDLQSSVANQGLIMTTVGECLDPSGKMIQIVSLRGEDGQYLSLADGQQMQILNPEDLGLTSEALESIDSSVDLNPSSDTSPNMGLMSLPSSTADITSGTVDISVADGKEGSADNTGIFAPGLPPIVALQGAGEGGQPQLYALQRPAGGDSLQMGNLLESEGISDDLTCQTITVMPTDLTQTGDMNYVLILSQADGSKDGITSMAQICDFKQETTEMTDTIVDENGETKNVLRLIPKKMMGDMNNQQLVCNFCNYTSPKRYLLTRHMKSHSEERPYKCDSCSRGFKTAASLLNHVNTHTGTRPHKCKTCESAFTTSGELVRHIRYRHTFEKPHRCPECDYASVELSKLKRHMRSHTGERPYKCPNCPYASPDTYKLKRHMRIHTGEKPYECDVCYARFTQSNSLKAHKLIHTGNKPVYQCTLCPTTCGRKTDLKIHFNKLHAAGSPLDCKKCGESFSDRYSFKQHLRFHDVDKLLRCDLCQYVAPNDKTLEQHMALHGKKYECDECHLSFMLKHLLDKHKAMFHAGGGKDMSGEAKVKDGLDGSFAATLNRFELTEIQPDSEEAGQLLSTPSTSDTLHKNLMQDIKEGKLGDVPQVVIVHPDGSQEEIRSKLTGDKWSIEELFSTATNNGQTQFDEPERDVVSEGSLKETELLLPRGGSMSSSVQLMEPLLQANMVEAPSGCADGSQRQEMGLISTEMSQLCEAGTQAELESDTDSDQERIKTDQSAEILASKIFQAPNSGHVDMSVLSASTSFDQPTEHHRATEVHKAPSLSSATLSSSSSVLNVSRMVSNSSNVTVKSGSGQQYSVLKNISQDAMSQSSTADVDYFNMSDSSNVKLYVTNGSKVSVHPNSNSVTISPSHVLTNLNSQSSFSSAPSKTLSLSSSLISSSSSSSSSSDINSRYSLNNNIPEEHKQIAGTNYATSDMLNLVQSSDKKIKKHPRSSNIDGSIVFDQSAQLLLPPSDMNAGREANQDQISSVASSIHSSAEQKEDHPLVISLSHCDNKDTMRNLSTLEFDAKWEVVGEEPVSTVSDDAAAVAIELSHSFAFGEDSIKKEVLVQDDPTAMIDVPSRKKGKAGKRPAEMDQSLVMAGKRVRKAVVRASY